MGMCYNPELVRDKPLGSLASVKWVYYPNQLAPKRGSQRKLRFDPNLTWWAYQAISLLSKPGTLSAGGLISPLFSPAYDGTFDQLQLMRATLIFKKQIGW